MQHKPVNDNQRSAFTLIELLIVIGIIAVLAAVLLPVIVQARERALRATCLSNMRQIGAAMLNYAQDADERTPTGLTPKSLFAAQIPANIGWAGRVYPYIKNTEVFHCPVDGTPIQSSQSGIKAPLQAVSYALNSNLSGDGSTAVASSPSHTVLLFEVAQSRVLLTTNDEGDSVFPMPAQLSAAGNGLGNTLLGWPKTPPAGAEVVVYDTGRMDNAPEDDYDAYQGRAGRHAGGGDFLALDGHVVWLPGSRISSGFSAQSATNPQSDTGCVWVASGKGAFPCAEGTEHTGTGAHSLTFSVR